MGDPVTTGLVLIGIAALARIFSESEKVESSDLDRGIQANTRSTDEALKIIYGQIKVGGNDIFITTSGSNNKTLWIVQTLGEGPIDSIAQSSGVDQLWLNEKLWNEYGGNISYYFHSGTSSQAVDSNLNSADATWTDCLKNTSYIVWKLIYNYDYFQGVPTRLALINGLQLFDFRDSTTAYSNNPVLCLYDYLTNNRYGLGFSSSKIDCCKLLRYKGMGF